MPDRDEDFPIEITEEEARVGFVLSTLPNPQTYYTRPLGMPLPDPEIHAVVWDQGNGLRVIKRKYPLDDSIMYVVWNADDRPVDVPFFRLDLVLSHYPALLSGGRGLSAGSSAVPQSEPLRPH